MKKYQQLIGIVVAGALTVSAQAGQTLRKSSLSGKSYLASSHQVKSKGVVRGAIKGNLHSKKVVSRNKLVRLPRNYRQVLHRGVRYYVSNGISYRPTRSGYVAVRTPW